jgi:hypothetical protein
MGLVTTDPGPDDRSAVLLGLSEEASASGMGRRPRRAGPQDANRMDRGRSMTGYGLSRHRPSRFARPPYVRFIQISLGGAMSRSQIARRATGYVDDLALIPMTTSLWGVGEVRPADQFSSDGATFRQGPN